MMKNARKKLELMLVALLPIILFTACSDDDDDKLVGEESSLRVNGIPVQLSTVISYETTYTIYESSSGSHTEEFSHMLWGYAGDDEFDLAFYIEPENESSSSPREEYLNLYNGKDITSQFSLWTMFLGNNYADWASEFVGGTVTVVSFDSEQLTIKFSNYTWEPDASPSNTVDNIILDGELTMKYQMEYRETY